MQEAVLSTEMKAKEELRIALEKARREFHQESEMMALQVTDLQASLTRAEQQGTRREEHLRQEIKHFQQVWSDLLVSTSSTSLTRYTCLMEVV